MKSKMKPLVISLKMDKGKKKPDPSFKEISAGLSARFKNLVKEEVARCCIEGCCVSYCCIKGTIT